MKAGSYQPQKYAIDFHTVKWLFFYVERRHDSSNDSTDEDDDGDDEDDDGDDDSSFGKEKKRAGTSTDVYTLIWVFFKPKY